MIHVLGIPSLAMMSIG